MRNIFRFIGIMAAAFTASCAFQRQAEVDLIPAAMIATWRVAAESRVRSIVISNDGQLTAVVESNDNLRLLSLAKGELRDLSLPNVKRVLAFTPDNRTLAVHACLADASNSIFGIDTKSGSVIYEVIIPTMSKYCVTNDGRILVVEKENQWEVRSLSTGEIIDRIPLKDPRGGVILAAATTCDGKGLILYSTRSGSSPDVLYHFDLTKQQPAQESEFPYMLRRSCQIDPEKWTLLSVVACHRDDGGDVEPCRLDRDGGVYGITEWRFLTLDLTTRAVTLGAQFLPSIHSPPNPADPISLDGKCIVRSKADEVFVHRVPDSYLVARLKAIGEILATSISSDGRYVAGGGTRDIHVWDLQANGTHP